MRHFVVLAETLNFSRAADRLHMAQPPLSVSIQKLEAELGIKLFVRGPAGVALTASGAAALPQARKLLLHGAQLAQMATDAANGTGGRLRIGFAGSAIYKLLPSLVPAYRARFPDVELVLREATSASIIEQLEGDTLDIGLVRMPLLRSTTISLVTLQRDPFVAALPRANPLAQKQNLRLSDLANEPFVMYAQDSAPGLHGATMLACQKAGFLPRVAQEAVQLQTVLALVESGLGVAIVPLVMQRFRSEGIVYRPLTDDPPITPTSLALAYRSDTEVPAARNFRGLAIHAEIG